MGFLGFKNPAKKAQPYLEKIAPMAKEQYNPYIERGQEAGNQAYGQYQQMAGNPSNFLNDLLAGYTPSKGFDFKKNQALGAMRNSAAAGGFAGSEADQTRQGELANSLASQDMYEWLDRVLGQHGQGLQGLSGLQQQGFQGSGALTDILGQTYGNQGQLAFQGQHAQNQGIMDLGKILASLAGAAMGGPAGAKAGGAIGGAFGGPTETPPYFPGGGGYRSANFAGMAPYRSDQNQPYQLPQSGMYPTNIW